MGNRIANNPFVHKLMLIGGLLTTTGLLAPAVAKAQADPHATLYGMNTENKNDIVIVENTAQYPKPQRAAIWRPRLNAYVPLACYHSERELGGLPVRYNETKNWGLFVNYNVFDWGKTYFSVGAGAYLNSLNAWHNEQKENTAMQISKSAMAEIHHSFDHRGKFTLSLQAGFATYRKLDKHLVTDAGGNTMIIAGGKGDEEAKPMAMLAVQYDLIENKAMTAGIKMGFTKNPKDGTSLTTFGIVLAPKIF